MDEFDAYEQIRVMVETSERTFRGFVHKPVKDGRYRLSDHLNEYGNNFICLTDVQVNERGQQYRAGDQYAFVAIAVQSITFITPVD